MCDALPDQSVKSRVRVRVMVRVRVRVRSKLFFFSFFYSHLGVIPGWKQRGHKEYEYERKSDSCPNRFQGERERKAETSTITSTVN